MQIQPTQTQNTFIRTHNIYRKKACTISLLKSSRKSTQIDDAFLNVQCVYRWRDGCTQALVKHKTRTWKVVFFFFFMEYRKSVKNCKGIIKIAYSVYLVKLKCKFESVIVTPSLPPSGLSYNINEYVDE